MYVGGEVKYLSMGIYIRDLFMACVIDNVLVCWKQVIYPMCL